MKKVIMILTLSCIFVLGSHAQDVMGLQVTKTDGTTQAISIKSVDKITFNKAGEMVVNLVNGTSNNFLIVEVNKIAFGMGADGIINKSVNETAFINYSSNKNALNVTGEGIIKIYSVNGQMLKSMKVAGKGLLNIEELPK